jgi:hypothetical protein
MPGTADNLLPRQTPYAYILTHGACLLFSDDNSGTKLNGRLLSGEILRVARCVRTDSQFSTYESASAFMQDTSWCSSLGSLSGGETFAPLRRTLAHPLRNREGKTTLLLI